MRDATSLDIVQVQHCLDAVQYIEWSSDGLYVLCAMFFKRALVQIWSVEDPEWTCKIDEGSAGLDGVRWSPDGRHVLTWAAFQLRITIWSLVSQQTCYIKAPKFAVNGAEFSRDGRYFAVLERRDYRDHVSIYSCDAWKMVRYFPVDTNDAADLSWSPDGSALAVYDSLLDYKVLVYSAAGRCLGDYSAYDNALGIKRVLWSPSSQLLAVGSYDQAVRLLNNATWRVTSSLKHDIVDSMRSVV